MLFTLNKLIGFSVWTTHSSFEHPLPWSIPYLQKCPHMLFFILTVTFFRNEVFVFQSPALSQRVTARVRISENSNKKLIHSLGPITCSILDLIVNLEGLTAQFYETCWHSRLLWNTWQGIMVAYVPQWKPWSGTWMQPTFTGLHIFYKNAMDRKVFTSSAPELLEPSGLLHNKQCSKGEALGIKHD